VSPVFSLAADGFLRQEVPLPSPEHHVDPVCEQLSGDLPLHPAGLHVRGKGSRSRICYRRGGHQADGPACDLSGLENAQPCRAVRCHADDAVIGLDTGSQGRCVRFTAALPPRFRLCRIIIQAGRKLRRGSVGLGADLFAESELVSPAARVKDNASTDLHGDQAHVIEALFRPQVIVRLQEDLLNEVPGDETGVLFNE